MEKIDYSFAERDDVENWVVHIKSGKWKETYVTFGKVTIQPPEGETWESLEEKSDGVDLEPVLSYNYGIIESPFDPEELIKDPEFNNHIGDLLSQIIQESFDKGDYKIGDKDASESRNDNPEESDQ